MGEAGAGHLFFDAAFAQEIGFLPLDEAVEHHVGLVDENDGDVGESLGGAGFGSFAVKPRVGVIAAYAAGLDCFFGILVPKVEVPHPKVVLVVEEQFLEAGFGHVGEFDFDFAGRGAVLAAFGDVLFARPRGLPHLVDCAVARPEEAFGEDVGYVKNTFGHGKYFQAAEISTLGKKVFVGWHRL